MKQQKRARAALAQCGVMRRGARDNLTFPPANQTYWEFEVTRCLRRAFPFFLYIDCMSSASRETSATKNAENEYAPANVANLRMPLDLNSQIRRFAGFAGRRRESEFFTPTNERHRLSKSLRRTTDHDKAPRGTTRHHQ